MSYITRFKINDHPRIRSLEFSMDFGDEEFLNLIITGRNGTGKSTLLNVLWTMLDPGNRGKVTIRPVLQKRDSFHEESRNLWEVAPRPGAYVRFGDIEVKNTVPPRYSQNFLLLVTPDDSIEDTLQVFLKDIHRLSYHEVIGKVPQPVELTRLKNSRASDQFVPYLKHQHLQMLLAKANNEESRSKEISQWLDRLTSELGLLFEIDGLRMRFDSSTYELKFVEPDGTSYNFSQLSAGFAAVLDMVGELIMRINAVGKERDAVNVAGIALIDEIDAHLHPRIQEKILPFLTRMFPRVQFVVATHSPAIIGSISNAIVFDLDRLESCPSSEYLGTPYGQVMTAHFGLETDFGDETTKELKEVEALSGRTDLSPDEEAHRLRLIRKLRKTRHPLVMAAYAEELEKQALAEERRND